MTRHIMVVELDTEYNERFPSQAPELKWRLECPDGNGCKGSGYEECSKDHEVDGIDASIGPYDCTEDAPWYDEEEFEFHGVWHTWHWGYNWTVPYAGCVAQCHIEEPPIDMELTVGEHPVDVVWEDEESCYLELLEDE